MHKDQNKNSNKQNKGDLFFYFVILKPYANKKPIYIVLIIKLQIKIKKNLRTMLAAALYLIFSIFYIYKIIVLSNLKF